MTSQRDEDILGRLMSGRDGMDIEERERRFDAIFALVSSQDPKPHNEPTSPMLGAFAIAAAALFAISFSTMNQEFAPQDTLTARGGDVSPHQLEWVCTTAGTSGPCTQGATLSFRAHSTSHTHVALFSRHTERATIIWYTPASPQDTSLALPTHQETWLPTSVNLSSHHPPGTYTLHAVFSSTPLTRADVKARVRAHLQDPTPDILTRMWVMP